MTMLLTGEKVEPSIHISTCVLSYEFQSFVLPTRVQVCYVLFAALFRVGVSIGDRSSKDSTSDTVHDGQF